MAVIQKKVSQNRSNAESSSKKLRFDKRALPHGEYLFFLSGDLEDFYELEEKKFEFLAEGILVIHSSAPLKHEEIFGDLLTRMYFLAEENKLGEVLGSCATVALGDYRLQPDLMFIARDNAGKFGEYEFFGAPELVVEIVSKTTRPYDLKIKREIYRESKIPEIYFIDYLNKQLIVDVLQGGQYVSHTLNEGEFASAVLKGFAVKCYG